MAKATIYITTHISMEVDTDAFKAEYGKSASVTALKEYAHGMMGTGHDGEVMWQGAPIISECRVELEPNEPATKTKRGLGSY
jgi:hypothetical protein